MKHKLPDDKVGKNIGQMKLEHEIIQGVFPRKKLYAIKNSNNKLIIKASGANSNVLTFKDIVNISKGIGVSTKRIAFRSS
jgi:hypothetical protein